VKNYTNLEQLTLCSERGVSKLETNKTPRAALFIRCGVICRLTKKVRDG